MTILMHITYLCRNVLMKHTTINNEYETVFKKLLNQIDFIGITSLQFGSLLSPRTDWKVCSILTVFLDQLGNS